MHVSAADQDGVMGENFGDVIIDPDRALAMQDDHFVFVRVLVQRGITARFHAKIAGDEMGFAFVFAQQDMQGGVFDACFGGHHSTDALPAVIVGIACELVDD